MSDVLVLHMISATLFSIASIRLQASEGRCFSFTTRTGVVSRSVTTPDGARRPVPTFHSLTVFCVFGLY